LLTKNNLKLTEEFKISEELNKALLIDKTYLSKEGNKVFTFKLGCIDAILRFFLIWIFSIGNILIAFGEIISMLMNSFPKEVWFLPIVHFLLLLFPYFMLRDMPPKGIEVSADKLLIAYKKVFKGYWFKSITLSDIQYLKSRFTSYKGTLRTEIKGILLSKKSEIIFKTKISKEEKHKLICNFFADLLDKEIRE